MKMAPRESELSTSRMINRLLYLTHAEADVSIFVLDTEDRNISIFGPLGGAPRH